MVALCVSLLFHPPLSPDLAPDVLPPSPPTAELVRRPEDGPVHDPVPLLAGRLLALVHVPAPRRLQVDKGVAAGRVAQLPRVVLSSASLAGVLVQVGFAATGGVAQQGPVTQSEQVEGVARRSGAWCRLHVVARCCT